MKPTLLPSLINSVFTRVCERYGISRKQLTSRCREWRFVWPRWCAEALLDGQGVSHSQIALAIRKDRASIIHALHTFKLVLEQDPNARRDWAELSASQESNREQMNRLGVGAGKD